MPHKQTAQLHKCRHSIQHSVACILTFLSLRLVATKAQFVATAQIYPNSAQCHMFKMASNLVLSTQWKRIKYDQRTIKTSLNV